MVVDRIDIALFNDLAQIHHRHTVAHMADHSEVMGDDYQREPQLIPQIAEQVNHLRLHRHIKGRDRLIPDHQLRGRGQRAGNPDPLALAARKFMWVAFRVLGAQADFGQQFRHFAAPLRGGHFWEMRLQRFADQLANTHARVQRRKGVLKDELHVSAQRGQVAPGKAAHIAAVKLHIAIGRG